MSDPQIEEQHYLCPEGHYVRVEGEDVDPHNDIIIDLFCEQHENWIQPVPEPGDCDNCGEYRPIIQAGVCQDCMEETLARGGSYL